MSLPRWILALLASCLAFQAFAQAADVSPARIGALAADAYLGRPDFSRASYDDMNAVHYADVASAYGALRLAEVTGDEPLFQRVAARHRQLLAEAIPNTANHVDANVYGVWPLELYRRTGDPADLARGLAMADGQWAKVTPDGLTAQARYWIDDIWMIGSLQVEAWRATVRR